MAGKEGASYAPKPKDEQSFQEKAWGLGKGLNKITIPVGLAVTVGATALGAPMIAAGALAGVGTDYMIGEYTEEHRKKLEQKRLQKGVKEKVVFDARNRNDYDLVA